MLFSPPQTSKEESQLCSKFPPVFPYLKQPQGTLLRSSRSGLKKTKQSLEKQGPRGLTVTLADIQED